MLLRRGCRVVYRVLYDFNKEGMSSKILANRSRSPKRSPTLFYKTDQIRFRSLLHSSYKKLPRQQYVIPKNPWLSLKKDQINRLVDRLDDKPQQLYQAIQKRNRRNKFTLLQPQKQKQNRLLLRSIEAKKKKYQAQFRELFKGTNSSSLNILLPKIQKIQYVYKDDLHMLSGPSSFASALKK